MAGVLAAGDISKAQPQVLTQKSVTLNHGLGGGESVKIKAVNFDASVVDTEERPPAAHVPPAGALSSNTAVPKQKRPPTKHASMMSLGKGSHVVPTLAIDDGLPSAFLPAQTGSQQATQPGTAAAAAAEDKTKKKSVSRSISTYFKNLFKKTDSGGSDQPRTSESPSGLSRATSSVSLKSAKSSTAAIEGEVAAAMKRAASISGLQHAPTTLLAISRDLPPRMQRSVWSLRDYAVIEKMYTGYASNVYKAFCKLSGETVCLKSYSLSHLCELNRFQIFREVKLHSSLSHDHIIKLYGGFQQADQIVLVQEYAEAGDLFNLLQGFGGRLPERTCVEMVIYPFLCVIHYLHSNGIAHRDIKPENILFTADMKLKLCDFGLAINMRDERAVTRAGTLEYMAPEVLNCPFKNKPDENKENHRLHYSFHVDTWAAGVLTYELLVGVPPFSDKQRNMIEDKIRLEMPRFPSRMSELAQDFIKRALDKDPIERPTIQDMINHRWVRTLRRSASVRQIQIPKAPSAGKVMASGPSSAAMSPCAEDDSEGMVLSPTSPHTSAGPHAGLPGSINA